MHDDELKRQVRSFWDAEPCGTFFAGEAAPLSPEYFQAIEDYRYGVEGQIFSFAQFTRFRGRKVLEVGVGAGTDFTQWVRAGALAHGVDLTPRGVELTRRRLEIEGLEACDLRVADAENLPYDDATFDLVYSWGVIHHTPDTAKALAEIVRVTRPGGRAKIMIYNRHSLHALYIWAANALLRGRPWRGMAWCLHNHVESLGTKAFTRAELEAMLAPLPVARADIRAALTYADTMSDSRRPWARLAGNLLARLAPTDRCGWFMTADLLKAR